MDTPRVLLEHYLKQLRLPTIVREFSKLAEQCAKEGATFEQFLLRLVEQEMLDRERRATERRIKAAKFPVSKSLETYDFLAIPSLNKKLVVELSRGEWIGRRENVLALGNSGTGKTHIGLTLGLAACQQGFRVRFTTAASLVHELIEARDEKRLLRYRLADGSCERWQFDEVISAVAERRDGAGLVVTMHRGFASFDPETTGARPVYTNRPDEPEGNRFNDGKCDAQGRFWGGTMDFACKAPITDLESLKKQLDA